MNELFTFNSQQLSLSMKRPSSTDNPPIIRKRIIKSILSKKHSLVNQPPFNHEDLTHLSQERKNTTTRKVRFNMDGLDFYEKDTNIDRNQITTKTRLAHRKQGKGCAVDRLLKKIEFSRSPLQDIRNKKKNHELGKRSLSSGESRNIQGNPIKNEEIIERPSGSSREKRTLSLKLSPKIVPVSDHKLPKAFKMKYLVDNNLRQPQRKKIKIREIVSCQIKKKLFSNQMQISTAISGISQLEKMLQLQAKIFQKLYHPRQ